MEFKSRLSAPSNTEYYRKNNPFYPKYSMFKNNGNCTDYAYYRFKEEQEIDKCSLPTSNAESWMKNNKVYKTGMTAKLGAIAVWSKGIIGNGKDGSGHVAVVEGIYPDGSILTSNSGYNSRLFYLKRINKGYYMFGYRFLGFIYPSVEFSSPWESGKYKLLKSKAIRNTHELTNNILKVKQIGLINRVKLTSNKPNDNAFYKAGTVVNVKSIYKDSVGRIWGQLNGAWIVLCNKDGTIQANKV